MLYALVFSLIVAVVFYAVNYFISTDRPYVEKTGPFESGFDSFSQTRAQFNIAFYLVGLLFLVFDLELLLIYPLLVSSYVNGLYGFWVALTFLAILTLGFLVELSVGALRIFSE